MYDFTLITDTGLMLGGDDVIYSLNTDENNPTLIIQSERGTTFYNWHHVVSFGASPAGLVRDDD